MSGSNDAELDGMDDWLTVFEQSETGCIDQWNMVLHEQAARFGARGNTTGGPQGSGTTDGKEVVSVRWVGEPRAVSSRYPRFFRGLRRALISPSRAMISGIRTRNTILGKKLNRDDDRSRVRLLALPP